MQNNRKNNDLINLKKNICKKMKEKFKNFSDELDKINKNYTYNTKMKKIKKHFPNSVTNIDPLITFEDVRKKNKKIIEKGNIVSLAISHDKIEDQIDYLFETAKRRINTINVLADKSCHGFNTSSIISYFSKGIIKLEKNKIIEMGFVRSDKTIMFDDIYIIKQENAHFYVHLNKDVYCDLMLICINHKDKIFNIMFDSDCKIPINKEITEEMYHKKIFINRKEIDE